MKSALLLLLTILNQHKKKNTAPNTYSLEREEAWFSLVLPTTQSKLWGQSTKCTLTLQRRERLCLQPLNCWRNARSSSGREISACMVIHSGSPERYKGQWCIRRSLTQSCCVAKHAGGEKADISSNVRNKNCLKINAKVFAPVCSLPFPSTVWVWPLVQLAAITVRARGLHWLTAPGGQPCHWREERFRARVMGIAERTGLAVL